MEVLLLSDVFIYSFDSKRGLFVIGSVTGSFNLVNKFSLGGYNVLLICDSNGVYLIIDSINF